MINKCLFERDLLYPTNNILEPGSIHIMVLNPTKHGKMPIIIEGKSAHSVIEYFHTILRIMQSDVFDRVHINVKTNTNVYIKISEHSAEDSKYLDKQYIKVMFFGEKIDYVSTNEIEA